MFILRIIQLNIHRLDFALSTLSTYCEVSGYGISVRVTPSGLYEESASQSDTTKPALYAATAHCSVP